MGPNSYKYFACDQFEFYLHGFFLVVFLDDWLGDVITILYCIVGFFKMLKTARSFTLPPFQMPAMGGSGDGRCYTVTYIKG